MGSPELDLAELIALAMERRLSSIFGAARGEPIVIVHLDQDTSLDTARIPAAARYELGTLPVVIVGIGPSDHQARAVVDVIAEPDLDGGDAASIVQAVEHHPLASAALCLLLRHGEQRTVAAGLVAESATYSMLQAGPEFAAWLARRESTHLRAKSAPPVVVDHDGDTTTIALNRPHRHNAVDVGLSEGLVDALTEALADPSRRVVLRGNGPSFSSGGDLGEFGSFPDPVTAHVTRLSRNAGQLIAMMSDRVQVQLHGNCFGAGIELPAFAGAVAAAPNTRIALPELSLGLVPGAGGSVSLPRRIGRHRSALLALTGMTIDATTAHRWGVVDEVTEIAHPPKRGMARTTLP